MLYAAMDRKYTEISTAYGFICQGCADNCCRTHFYHHTNLEFFYLAQGFDSLGPEVRKAVLQRAESVVGMPDKAHRPAVDSMCPLNHDEKCILYSQRPMICRLHGTPHELRRPGAEPAYGPGCNDFDRQRRQDNYLPFDRTPFYSRLAGLEKDARVKLNLPGKIKLTVAEMIIRFEPLCAR